eukprot:6074364-Pyramimonas_sp.AAC.1
MVAKNPRPENHHFINFAPQGPLRPQGPHISEVMAKVRGRIAAVMPHRPRKEDRLPADHLRRAVGEPGFLAAASHAAAHRSRFQQA